MASAHCNRTLTLLLLPVLAVVAALAGCGSSSSAGSGGDAPTLLRQTFTGSHHLTSGRLALSLNVDPGGSSTLVTPITLSFGGPFQTRGSGLPSSDFTASISALGRQGSLGIISTGSAGYLTLAGSSYQLPGATFRKLEASFAGLAGQGGHSSGGLGRLGIDPLRWLRSPTVVGNENLAGVGVTRIHAGVDVVALLGDLNTFIGRAAAAGVRTGSASGQLSAATRQRIAASIRNPGVDVWTGRADHTIRKLEISMTVPVTGRLSSQLGGLKSLGIDLTVAYTQLGVPQTITAPTALHPFSEFQTKLQALLTQVGAAAGSLLGGSSSSGGTTTPGASTGPGASPTPGASTTAGAAAYGACITAAHNDVTKMQRCASLLPSG